MSNVLRVKSDVLKSEKPIFDSGYAPVSLLIMGSSLLCCSVLLIFLLFHIRNHPVAYSLVSLFLLRTMLDAKVEKFMLWEDRMVVVSRRLFVTRRRVVLFSAVESVDIRPVEEIRSADAEKQ